MRSSFDYNPYLLQVTLSTRFQPSMEMLELRMLSLCIH